MDWSKGFSSEYYLAVVDPASWRDLDRLEITGGNISRKAQGLRQAADVDCTSFNPTQEMWVRIWLVATQRGDIAHEALFTGLTSVPEQNIDGNRVTYPVNCYSVLKPAEDVLLQRGWYAKENANSADVITDLLTVTPAPVVCDSVAPKLMQDIVAEDGETHLSMVNKVLDAINWRMTIDGDGTIHVGEWDDRTVAGSFGVYNDIIEPKVSLKSDWFSCPNVFRATSGDMVSVARDDNPDSFLSTVRRGREVWKEERDVALSDSEGLDQYAKRRLSEEQSVAYSVKYDRRYAPGINVGDIVRFNYPDQGIIGEYVVSSQHISLGFGATVSEEVLR